MEKEFRNDLRRELEDFFCSESEYTKNHFLFLTNEIISILDELNIKYKKTGKLKTE